MPSLPYQLHFKKFQKKYKKRPMPLFPFKTGAPTHEGERASKALARYHPFPLSPSLPLSLFLSFLLSLIPPLSL